MIPAPPKIDEADIPIRMSSARRDLAMLAAVLLANTNNFNNKNDALFYDCESAVHDAWHIMKAAKEYDPNNATYLQVKL